MDTLKTLLSTQIGSLEYKIIQSNIDKITSKSNELELEELLNYLDKERQKCLSDYPTPTTCHMETVNLGSKLQDLLIKFVTQHPEYKEWWENAKANQKIKEYPYSYAPMIMKNGEIVEDPDFD